MKPIAGGPAICADCGLETIEAGEWYNVLDEIWLQAWEDHILRLAVRLAEEEKTRAPGLFDKLQPALDLANGRRPGPQILCIGCLEKRIGRTLTGDDFTDVSVNNLSGFMSDRMRDRLATVLRAG